MVNEIDPSQRKFAELLDQVVREKFGGRSYRQEAGAGNAAAAKRLGELTHRQASAANFSQWRSGRNLPGKDQIEPLLATVTNRKDEPRRAQLLSLWRAADQVRQQRRARAGGDQPIMSAGPDEVGPVRLRRDREPAISWNEGLLASRHLLRVGATRTLWEHRLGHGEPIPWHHIRCRIDHEDVHLHPEFESLLAEEKRHIAENPRLFDGHQLALRDINEYRSDNEEKYVDILFARSRYSQFRAVNVNPVGRSRRTGFLANWSVLSTPIDWLSLGVGVHICVFTSDSFLVAVRRAEGIRVREQEYDFGVVEGISQHLDGFDTSSFSLQAVTLRAAREEFGLLPEDIDRTCCVGLGYDLHYSQWNFLGAMHTNLCFDELKNDRFVQFAKTKFEIAELIAIPNNIEEIKRFIKPRRIWSSGMACLYYALIENRKSAQEVHRSFRGFVMDNLEQYSL